MVAETPPRIAILILNWNNYPDTKACLESLASLTYPALELVLVDNGSSDGSADRLRSAFPDLKVLDSEVNLGFAGGNNIGLRYILENEFPYVLFLNNDTEVRQPDFLSVLVEAAENEREVAAVGPKVTRLDGTPDQVILPFPTFANTLRNTMGMYAPRYDSKQYVDSLIGCCVLVRSEAIRQVGLLDENYFMYMEETEWFYRMREAGWKVQFIPVSSVVHKGGASSRRLDSSKIYIERRANVIYTLVKHGYQGQALATALLMESYLAIRVLAGSLQLTDGADQRLPWAAVPEMVRVFRVKWKLAMDQASKRA